MDELAVRLLIAGASLRQGALEIAIAHLVPGDGDFDLKRIGAEQAARDIGENAPDGFPRHLFGVLDGAGDRGGRAFHVDDGSAPDSLRGVMAEADDLQFAFAPGHEAARLGASDIERGDNVMPRFHGRPPSARQNSLGHRARSCFGSRFPEAAHGVRR